MTETRKIRVTSVQRYYGEPTHDIDVIVTVDWFALAATLGKKAFFNASGKSRSMKGAIKVKAVKA